MKIRSDFLATFDSQRVVRRNTLFLFADVISATARSTHLADGSKSGVILGGYANQGVAINDCCEKAEAITRRV